MVRPYAWEPNGYYRSESNVVQFMEEYGYESYEELIPRSEASLSSVWGDMVEDAGIRWEQPYQDVVDTSDGVEFARWFTDGTLNATETILDKWVDRTPDRPMYRWEDEDGTTEAVTYAQMDRPCGQIGDCPA